MEWDSPRFLDGKGLGLGGESDPPGHRACVPPPPTGGVAGADSPIQVPKLHRRPEVL
jgi:hypothetical protein